MEACLGEDTCTVSIVVPVYNAEAYLRQCVESLIGQTHGDIEVVLVDDGSTDGSASMCDAYAAADERIHVIHQPNSGVSAARNVGIEASSGDFLMFVDADDWIVPDAVEEALEALAGSGADVAFFDYSPATAEGTVLGRAGNYGGISGLVSPAEMRRRCLDAGSSQMLSGCYLLILSRQQLMQSAVRFDTRVRMMEDLLFTYEVLCGAGRVFVLDADLYRYRQTASSASHGYIPTLESDGRLVYGRLLALGAPEDEAGAWGFALCGRMALNECRSPEGLAAVRRSMSALKRDFAAVLGHGRLYRRRIRRREYILARCLSLPSGLAAAALRLVIVLREGAR